MNLIIKKIVLENFKGIKNKTIEFDSKLHRIEGKNASGKTTLATAYFWVFGNTDYELKSNPAIFPLDVEECTPSVEITMFIDDSPVKICKKQTRKVTESNGVRKIALTNSYFVNDVPMAERDMTKKLADMGLDFENFSILANPNAFLLEKKDIQRKVLFSMVSSYTDFDIANRMDGVDAAKELLVNYTVDEIKAMQNATLKKINDVYGKKGEILNAKIEGLELSKTDIDFAEIELNKNLLNQRLEVNREAQRVARSLDEEINKLHSEDMELQFKISGINSQIDSERKALSEKQLSERKDAQDKAFKLDNDIRRYRNEVEAYERTIQRNKAEKETLEKRLAEAKALTMDVSKTVCPVCNRPYDEQKIGEIKSEFEKEKAKSISETEMWLKENESLNTVKLTEMAEIKQRLEQAISDRRAFENVINKPTETLQENSEKILALLGEISTLEAERQTKKQLIQNKESLKPNMNVLLAEDSELNGQIRNCEIQLSKATLNVEIDEKIEDLRQQQREFEQNRANAEKILYQLDMIQREKNLVATEEINKHFSLVHWKLFDYLKNGSYTETCVPMVGDKELGAALNNAMQIRAKIDICNSLQNFYDIHYPIFLDNSEALDNENQNKLAADTQLILLSVKD